ncbi:MAG: peptide chain release factor N(5)-glutamine methyltransferase [Thermodesulfobacteriota bacterium]
MSPAASTLRALYRQAVGRLQAAGVAEAAVDAALLLGQATGLDRAQVILEGDRSLDVATIARFQSLLDRRLAREPMAYIRGEQEFFSLSFLVSPAVLIPRPETEALVEQALPLVPRPGGLALDLGTGSGVLAICLARELPHLHVVAVDRSAAALGVAAANCRRHGVRDRVQLIRSSWTSCLRSQPLFDLVVSNPPYIGRQDLAGLEPEVRDHEPHLALAGGEAGWEILAHLLAAVPAVLRPGGWLLTEIGAGQAEVALHRLRDRQIWSEARIHPDYSGLPRVLIARRRAS